MLIENALEGADLVQVLTEQILRSERISFSVSFLCYSGYALVVKELKKALARGAEVRILTSTFNYVTQPDALRGLLRLVSFPTMQTKLYDGPRPFHVKSYIFKYKDDPSQGSVIVGSSNLSKSGLKGGFEWSLLVNNPQTYHDAERLFRELWDLPESKPLSAQVVNAYEVQYKRYHRTRLDCEEKVVRALQAAEGGQVVKPNDAQAEALRQLATLRQFGIDKAAVVAAAGIGKTYLSAFDVKQAGARSLLFLAHKTELLDQAQKTFAIVLPSIQANIVSEGREFADAPFCFATVQSLTSKSNRMGRIDPRFFEYFVIDEFHHAAASTYQLVLDYFHPRFLLGLTATPERPDGKSVLDICNNNVAYRVDLPEAINRGWLVPFHYYGVADDSEVVYDDIPWRNGQFDFAILEDHLMRRRTEFIIEKIEEYGYDGIKRRAVGFCAGRRHAHYLAEEFRKNDRVAIALTGEDPIEVREDAYKRLADPEDPLEFIFVPDILNEGVDIPSLNLILFLRPTTSIIVFLQQLGRGLRLHPEKEVLTVIDFVANHTVAWNPLRALEDPSKRQVTRKPGDIIPPEGCRVILEDKTREILVKFQQRTVTVKQLTGATLREMRGELGRRLIPVDFLAFPHAPPFWEVSKHFGGWVNAQQHLGDAEEWETTLPQECRDFLLCFEKSWQLQRIGPYAKVWGLLEGASPGDAINVFLHQFPEWRCEEGGFIPKNIEKKLEEKLKMWYAVGDFTEPTRAILRHPTYGNNMITAIQERITYHLKYHFRACYEGVLRFPRDLLLGHNYLRPDIVNHFQMQYDPAKHHTGVMKFLGGTHVALLVNLKKGSDRERLGHNYQDKPLSRAEFQWESQNKDAPDSANGLLYINHEVQGVAVHLFAQPRQGDAYVYLGLVLYLSHTGQNPMRVTWRLLHPLTDEVFAQLYPQHAEQVLSDFDWSLL